MLLLSTQQSHDKVMKQLFLDRIASATCNIDLHRQVRVQSGIIAKEGYIIAGRVIGEKNTYNRLENCDGRMVPLHQGDIIAGVLGHRNALRGYCGTVPNQIVVGDRLHILNLGGVIGHCNSWNADVGPPFEVEILGAILIFPELASRVGVPAHIGMHVQKATCSFAKTPKVPIVFVAGTCMHAGKTMAACQIIRHLTLNGLRVGACKLTGVSLLRDVLNMRDYGAKCTASFMDAGIVTTHPDSVVDAAYTVIGTLATQAIDVIIAELGDGIMGLYGVECILQDSLLMERCRTFVLCANDPVGAWGGVERLKTCYDVRTDIITGPTTDNEAGVNFIENTLGVVAVNARKTPSLLGQAIQNKLNRT